MPLRDKVISLASQLKKKRVLLLAHEHADLDAVCSAAIFQRFLKKRGVKSVIGVPRHANEQALGFAKRENVSLFLNPELDEFDVIILFDLNSFEQLGSLGAQLAQFMKPSKSQVFVFDHHEKRSKSIVRGKNAFTDASCVSTTQLLYNLLDTFFDAKMHFWNCVGILEDTGHFLVGNNNSFASFSDSLSKSKRTYPDVLVFTKHSLPKGERIAFLKAAQRAEINSINGVVVVSSTVSFFESHVASKLLEFGADIAIVAGKEKSGLTTLSARCETSFRDSHKFNLVKHLLLPLQASVGGVAGGHSGAAQWKGSVEPSRVISEAISILRKRF